MSTVLAARRALFVARHDLRRVLRQRETWLWSFVLPLAFFYFFTMIQGGSSPSPGSAPTPLTFVAPEGDLLADELARRLAERGFELERVAELAPGEAPTSVLRAPEHFSADVESALVATLEFTRAKGGPAFELERLRVLRASWGVLADVVALAARSTALEPTAFEALRAQPRSVRIEAKPAGRSARAPSGAQQSIPGTMVMFTMILLLMSTGMGLVAERRAGLLRRLAATPLSRFELFAGRWLAVFTLGVVQLAYAMAVGAFAFDVDWGPDGAVVALVLAAWAAFNASLALALASVARTEAQIVGASVLGANVLSALGGCWWPIEMTPRWMQELASWLPTGWVMNALHRLMLFESGPSAAYLALAWLALGALALGALGARRFRYE